jgi:Arc/MetJ-type ribon-helix-helix transcriptional regulator
MQNTAYQRFAISMPAQMAAQIEELCQRDGRNRSEFFREAVRHYIKAERASSAATSALPSSAVSTGQPHPAPQFVLPNSQNQTDIQDNPFHAFGEWSSEQDDVYNSLR